MKRFPCRIKIRAGGCGDSRFLVCGGQVKPLASKRREARKVAPGPTLITTIIVGNVSSLGVKSDVRLDRSERPNPTPRGHHAIEREQGAKGRRMNPWRGCCV
jgi:hypothetical protein